MSEYVEVVGADRTKVTTAGLRVDVPQPWPPTGPENTDQRIAALESQLAETRLYVQILLSRVETLGQTVSRVHALYRTA